MNRTLDGDSALEEITGDLSDIISTRTMEDNAAFDDEFILAFDVSFDETSARSKIKAMYNYDAFHSAPSSVLYADRVVMNHFFSDLDGVGIQFKVSIQIFSGHFQSGINHFAYLDLRLTTIPCPPIAASRSRRTRTFSSKV